jgi:gas vesicle protein
MSSEMTEFRITSDLSALRGQVIEANFAEVREWLDTNLAPYREMAVTPDTMSTAKQYRANIRKVRDRIDESRKEAKNAALAAYSAFESKCKELTGLCDDAANAIDSQVKELEEAEKQEKIQSLRNVYLELADDEIESYCPWGCINNPKWANKGYSADAAAEEIRTAIENTRDDIATIRSMGGDDTHYLLDVYRQTRNISAVVRKASELKTMRQREEARAKEEAERMEHAAQAAHAPVIEETPPAQEKLFTVSFKVTCTKEQLSALGEYMKRNGIKYGRA